MCPVNFSSINFWFGSYSVVAYFECRRKDRLRLPKHHRFIPGIFTEHSLFFLGLEIFVHNWKETCLECNKKSLSSYEINCRFQCRLLVSKCSWLWNNIHDNSIINVRLWFNIGDIKLVRLIYEYVQKLEVALMTECVPACVRACVVNKTRGNINNFAHFISLTTCRSMHDYTLYIYHT